MELICHADNIWLIDGMDSLGMDNVTIDWRKGGARSVIRVQLLRNKENIDGKLIFRSHFMQPI